jgi:hypothetical protein
MSEIGHLCRFVQTEREEKATSALLGLSWMLCLQVEKSQADFRGRRGAHTPSSIRGTVGSRSGRLGLRVELR